MSDQVNNLLHLYFSLQISEVQRYVIEELDNLQVRGGFSATGFVGFDYKNQQWIEFNL